MYSDFQKKMQNKFPKVRGEQRPFGFSSALVPTPVPYLQIINQEDLFRQGGFSTIPPDFQYKIIDEGSIPKVVAINVSNSFQPLMQHKSAKNQVMSTKIKWAGTV